MNERANAGEGKPPPAGFWRSLFRPREAAPPPVDPLRCDTPMLRRAEIAAVYTGQRVAGDFYEFLRVSPSRMLFVLLDLAGLRADTRKILIAVQETFRTLAPKLFAGEDLNETTAMIELCNEMNLTILRGGLRSCPAFLGCYNEDLGHSLLCQCRPHSGAASRLHGNHAARGHRAAAGFVLAHHAERGCLSPAARLGAAGRLARDRRSGEHRSEPRGCGIWTGRSAAKLSACDRAHRARSMPDHAAGGSEVHTGDSHP